MGMSAHNLDQPSVGGVQTRHRGFFGSCKCSTHWEGVVEWGRSWDILIHIPQYNNGVPECARFATHSKNSKGTVESLQREEGLTDIRKLRALNTR